MIDMQTLLVEYVKGNISNCLKGISSGEINLIISRIHKDIENYIRILGNDKPNSIPHVHRYNKIKEELIKELKLRNGDCQ